MSYYAVLYTYGDDRARQDEIRASHRAFLASQAELVASGPFLNTAPGRALLIFKADDPISLAHLLDQDPFAREGQIAQREILEWNPVLGVFAEN